jgi:hypothetical protein
MDSPKDEEGWNEPPFWGSWVKFLITALKGGMRLNGLSVFFTYFWTFCGTILAIVFHETIQWGWFALVFAAGFLVSSLMTWLVIWTIGRYVTRKTGRKN